MDVEAFITRWSGATISERSHYQTFISQLCALIGTPAPDQEIAGDRSYCFERRVEFRFHDGGAHRGFIDCYRRGAFVLEAKQSQKRASAANWTRSGIWPCSTGAGASRRRAMRAQSSG